MNLIIAVIIAVFVIIPEVLAADREAAGSKGARKDLLRDQSFTSLMADLRQNINLVFSFSRCLNGNFP